MLTCHSCDTVAVSVLVFSVKLVVCLHEDHRGPWKWFVRRPGSGAGPSPAA